MSFQIKDLDEKIIFENYGISNKVDFTTRSCSANGCVVFSQTVNSPEEKQILTISFSSEIIDGKKMFEISKEYGKIVFVDSNNEETEVRFSYPFVVSALGKYLYTVVPEEINEAKEIKLVYTIRSDRYVYKIR